MMGITVIKITPIPITAGLNGDLSGSASDNQLRPIFRWGRHGRLAHAYQANPGVVTGRGARVGSMAINIYVEGVGGMDRLTLSCSRWNCDGE